MLTNLIDVEPSDVRIGMAVVVDFAAAGDDGASLISHRVRLFVLGGLMSRSPVIRFFQSAPRLMSEYVALTFR